MRKEVMPTWQELAGHAEKMAEIDPSSVLAMLEIMRVSDKIQHNIFDVLEREAHLSEGKFCVLIILHHQEGKPIAPSVLADMADVTRATISAMLQRMQRDGLVKIEVSSEDARGRQVYLTDKGEQLMTDILPEHYLRISRLMRRLTVSERQELINLLDKMTGENVT